MESASDQEIAEAYGIDLSGQEVVFEEFVKLFAQDETTQQKLIQEFNKLSGLEEQIPGKEKDEEQSA